MAFSFLALGPTLARAQSTGSRKPAPTFVPEARLDAILSSRSALQAGIGVSMFSGTYVRTGIIAAAGASRDGPSGRVDLFARFHLDPLRESRWGPYGGGGITTRMDRGETTRSYLLVFVGIDGPINNGLTTSVEAGLGGGARLGVILRRAVAERR